MYYGDSKRRFHKADRQDQAYACGRTAPYARHRSSMFKYLPDIGVPYSRLHNVGGGYASYKWVDVPNIFRDFDADENDPASYDFAFTDLLITELVKANSNSPFVW